MKRFTSIALVFTWLSLSITSFHWTPASAQPEAASVNQTLSVATTARFAVIGGSNQGTYAVPPHGGQRVTYNLHSGPVKVESTNNVPIIAALRDAWLVNGRVTSFSQLMGMPQGQLSDTFYFPAYNNVTLSGQLRFGVP